jgi:hypothetical protein
MEILSPVFGNTCKDESFASYFENELQGSEDEGDRDNEDC